MLKRSIIATVVVFVCWMAMDILIHGIFLKSLYEQTADLWRPEAEMKQGTMALVVAVSALFFTTVYARLCRPKSLAMGVQYGLFFGVVSGVSMGLGTYSYMPIPMELAVAWMAGSVAEKGVAGAIVGWIVKD
jgi:hypothetical protein